MKFSCDQCQAQYMIADEKVGAKGVKVRCKKCGNIISVTRDEAQASASASAPAAGAQPSAFDDIFGGGGGGASAPGAQDEERSPTRVFSASELQRVRDEQALAKGDGGAQSEAASFEAEKPSGGSKAEWYVAINDEQVGPITLEDVQTRWDRGDLSAASLGWKAGLADWAALSAIAELASVVSRPQTPKETPKPVHSSEAPKAEEKKEVVTWRPSGASALADLAKEATVEEPKKPEQPAESPFGMDFNPPAAGSDPFGGSPAFAGAAAAGPSTVWQFPAAVAKRSNSGTPKWLLGLIAFALLALVVVVSLTALGVLGPKPVVVAQAPSAPVAAPQPQPTPPQPPAAGLQPVGQPAATGTAQAVPPAAGVQATPPVAKAPPPKDAKPSGKKPGKDKDDDDDDKPAPVEKKPAKKGGSDAMDDLLEGGGGGGKKDVKPTLGRDDVLNTVKSNIGSIKACADAYSRSGGKLPPKLVAKWIIKPSGFTDAQEMASPELKGTPVDGCVVSAIKKWKFPEFSSGGGIPVTFPFPLAQ